MKISKVKHTKAGVGIKKEKMSGILYKSPGEDTLELEAHIKGLNKTAKKLYKVVMLSDDKDNDRKRFENYIINNFNELIAELLKKNLESLNLTLWMQENEYRKIFVQNNSKRNIHELEYDFATEKEEAVGKIVDGLLRNSLRKKVQVKESGNRVYVPDVVKILMLAMVSGSQFEDVIKKLSEDEICAFLTVLDRDYKKENQVKKIAKSIENQNVKVQCTYTDDRYKLRLTNAEHKTKKYIFDFIVKYADGNEESQETMLKHIRHLILLFYCGAERYSAEDEIASGPWNIDSLEADEKRCYSVKAKELLDKRAEVNKEDRAERRRLSDEIKQELKELITVSYRESIKVSGITEEDRFWLQFIEKNAEKLLTSTLELSSYKLSIRWLCERTWKEFMSFIAMKYVDMGKAVYHFTVPDLTMLSKDQPMTIGEVLPEYRTGITSFDYERIKAEESFNREMAVYLTFAIGNFDRAVRKNGCKRIGKQKEDILDLNYEKDASLLKENLTDCVLRFFGGGECMVGQYNRGISG